MRLSSLHIVFFLLVFLSFSLEGKEKQTSATQNSQVQGEEYRMLKLYTETGKHYKENNELEKAIAQYQMAIGEANRISDVRAKLDAMMEIGILYHRLSNFKEAQNYYFQVLESQGPELDQRLQSRAMSKVASIYQALGEFEMAYDYQLQSMQISEQLKDSVRVASSLYELGTLFFYQERYQQSLEYYQQAKVIFDQYKKEHLIYSCLGAIGSSYERLNQIELALDYNLKSLKKAEELDYTKGIAYSTSNIGSNYRLKGEYDMALEYLFRSLNLQETIQHRWGLISLHRDISQVYVDLKDYKKARIHIRQALDLAKELDSKSYIIEIYKDYANIHELLGNYAEAYGYMLKFTDLKDSILNETTLREMGKKKTMYEIEKRENEIALLKKEKEIFQKEHHIASLYRSILLGSVVFFILIIGLLYSRYRLQRKTNDLLAEKNTQIQMQNGQLEEANKRQQQTNKLLEENNLLLEDKNDQIRLQNEKLENSNEDLKQFAYVASHDLKEPLRMINAYTTLLQKRYAALFDPDAHEFMGYITDAVSRMETLLTDLLSYSRLNTQTYKTEWIESLDIVDIVLTTMRYKIVEQKIKVTVDRENMPKIKASRTQMNQLFQNLISNAIKFTDKTAPEIAVRCTVDDKEAVFAVRDNGIGISKENKEKIFEMFRRLHTQKEFEGSGIGLSTCKKIIEKHNG
ncbi:MAG: tetratricopeptide repeat protein, partial [Bacteroidota bacterium]